MSDARTLVAMITKDGHDEMASIGFTIACGGMTAGMDVMIFLTGPGVEIARRTAVDTVVVHPFDGLKVLMDDFMSRGGQIFACTPCCKARGYEQGDLAEGIVMSGAGPMHEQIMQGAGTLTF